MGAEKLALALQNHAHLRVTKNILLKSQNQFKGIAEALDRLRLNCTPLVVTDMTNLLYYCIMLEQNLFYPRSGFLNMQEL